MLYLLLLASVPRCEPAHLCPTDADLVSAIKAENAAQTQATAERPREDGSILLVHSFDPDGVSDVVCGDVLPPEEQSVMCKFTVRYPRSYAYRVAKLMKRGERWQITQAMEVSRER